MKRSQRPHVCDDECRAATARYIAGRPLVDSAGPRSAIWLTTRLHYHDIPVRPRRLTSKIQTSDAVARYQAGETLEQIGRSIGVTRERVRQKLAGEGVLRRRAGWKRNRPHTCRHACKIVLAAIEPLRISELAAQCAGETTITRLYAAAKWHDRRLAGQPGHMCDARCDTARTLLAAKYSLKRAAAISGISNPSLTQRYPSYHPDWNWACKRPINRPRIQGDTSGTLGPPCL